jgi:hypothetical protein
MIRRLFSGLTVLSSRRESPPRGAAAPAARSRSVVFACGSLALVAASCAAPVDDGSTSDGEIAESALALSGVPGKLPDTTTTLPFQGGSIMTAPTMYFIWYGNWAPGNTTKTIVEDFASNLGGSPYFNINTGYTGNPTALRASSSVAFGGSTSVGSFNGTALSTADVASTVDTVIGLGLLPNDSNGVYFVLTSSEVSQTTSDGGTFCGSFCGWHTFGTSTVSDRKYAFIGGANRCPSACTWEKIGSNFLSGPNGNAEADGMVSSIAHELTEAITDPYFNGWTDPSAPSSLSENGDLCNWTSNETYTVGGNSANMHLGSRDYLVQTNWVQTPFGGCDTRLHFSRPTAAVGRVTGDFDGDGGADILWRSSASHEASIWRMFGSTVVSTASLGVVPPNLQIYAMADFNLDTRSDIVWFDSFTGLTSVWMMNGSVKQSVLTFNLSRPANSEIQGAADLNHDGRADIIWRARGTAGLTVWLTNGTPTPTVVTIPGAPSAAWQVRGFADFDGDTNMDVLWQNTTTDGVSIWYMNANTTIRSTPLIYSGAGGPVTIRGVGNFNGSGGDDILWTSDSDPNVNAWSMNSAGTITGTEIIASRPSSPWRLVVASDYTGDGIPDLLWRNRQTGQLSLWTLNSSGFASSHNVSTVSHGWEVIDN